jgi:hypothetical protein
VRGIRRGRLPLAGSLVLLGLGAVGTGVRVPQGGPLAITGAAVVVIGILTAFSEPPVRTTTGGFMEPVRSVRVPKGAKLTWAEENPPPAELKEALEEMGVELEPALAEPESPGTRVFTARMGPQGMITTEDDLRTSGLRGTGLVKRTKKLGMELGGRSLVELTRLLVDWEKD